MPGDTTARRREPLSRERILHAALNLIDERGLAACTMRALGADLEVEAMSLYHHVPGKDALLDGVVELLIGELEMDPAEAPDWRAGLEAFATRFRAVALAHPHAFPLFARRPVAAYVAGRRLAEPSLAALREAGFEREDAIAGQRAVVRWVVGFQLVDVAGSAELADPHAAAARAGLEGGESPLLADFMDEVSLGRSDELFRFGLTLLLDGLETRLAARRPPPG